ncbi:MAG: fatty acid metabolism transcriptional regulator FadR [Anaerolineales bacterium]|nr:fatty acid metabolism transcriptional regulator FadR [Anaerolineales bacterium]
MQWKPPQRPAALTENRLIEAILGGEMPINSLLPAERELAAQLGITRPTLREALQRMARDGWIDIQHGKPTRVRNFWVEGSLGVLNAIAHHSQYLPANFIPKLLDIRLLLAPAYTSAAIRFQPAEIELLLAALVHTPDIAADFTDADWRLHRTLAMHAENPVFSLILNGFADLYQQMGVLYFQVPENRSHSRSFYQDLLQVTRKRDPEAAFSLSSAVMQASISRWGHIQPGE